MGSTSLRRILGSLLDKADVSCGMRSGVMCLSRGGTRRAGRRRINRRRAVAKRIVSAGKRVLVNIDVLRGKADGNAVASVSNGCALGIDNRRPMLMFSCVKCGALRVPNGGPALGIAVSSSARIVSRIIIATLNVGHRGGVLKCTIRRVGDSRLGGAKSPSIADTLRKGITNLRVGATNANLKNSAGVAVHNGSSLSSGGRPL